MAQVDIRGRLPSPNAHRRPVVFVHGAASSAGIWRFWQHALADAGWPTFAVTLRGHGPDADERLAATSMGDYADDVRAIVRLLAPEPVLVGWSMGGLVAMMAAADGGVAACVCLAPSTPARRADASVDLRTGEFGPEEYGVTSSDPEAQPAMPDLDLEERRAALDALGRESRLARDERRRGVVVPPLPCPLLIATGERDTQWPKERYADLPIPAEFLAVPAASHWGLVLNRRALAGLVPTVSAWLDRVVD